MNIKLVGIPLALGAVTVVAVGLFQSLGNSSAKSLEGSTWILDPRTDLVKSVNLGRPYPWYSTIEFLKDGRYKWTIFPAVAVEITGPSDRQAREKWDPSTKVTQGNYSLLASGEVVLTTEHQVGEKLVGRKMVFKREGQMRLIMEGSLIYVRLPE